MTNQQNMADNRIFAKVPRNFAVKSLKNGTHLLYRVNLLIAAFDKDGKGWVDKKEFMAWANANAKFTRQQFYDAISNPASHFFFWTGSDSNKVSYAGKIKLTEYFRTHPGEYAMIDVANLKHPEDVRAWFYACVFSPKGSTISRAKIEELTGIAKTSQIRYEKIAQIVVRPNMVMAQMSEQDMSDPESQQKFFESLPLPKSEDGERSIPVRRAGNKITWQTSNTYFPQYTARPLKYGRFSNRVRTVLKALNTSSDGSDTVAAPAYKSMSATKSAGNNGTGVDIGRRANQRVFYSDKPENQQFAYFTDQRESFIGTGRQTRTFQKNVRGNLLAYNKFAPTKDKKKANPYAFLDRDGFVCVGNVNVVLENIKAIAADAQKSKQNFDIEGFCNSDISLW